MKKDVFNSFEAEDFRIMDSPSLNVETSTLLVPLESWFDCDKKFGLNILTNDDVWLNLIAEYNPMTDELRMFYDVDTPEKSHQREYIMTDEESELLKKSIKQDIEKRNQMTCREYYLAEYMEHYVEEVDIECYESGGKIVVYNKADDFILYAEEKGGRLENHIGHSLELATYGGKECIAIECMDCNEILYDTATEELQFTEAQTKTETHKEEPDRWKNLLAKAVCYIGESEAGEELYDTLQSEIGMTDEEIEKIGFSSLSEYFGQEEEQQGGMTMQ